MEKRLPRSKLVGCSLVLLPEDTPPTNFVEKLSQIATKPRNSQMFSPSKVSHYMVSYQAAHSLTLQTYAYRLKLDVIRLYVC